MGKSHQRGWVVLRGKKWYGYSRRTVLDPTNNEEKVKALTFILGQKSQMTKFQAREQLELEIAKQKCPNPVGRVTNDGAVTFGWFVRNRFLPLKEANWKPETAKVKKLLISEGSDRQLRSHAAGELRPIHLASPPKQAGQN
jgi:hypothetical protein